MVDFQSRDTRRTVGDEDESEDPEPADETSDEAEAGAPDGADEADRETRTVTEDVGEETFAYAVLTVAGDRTLEQDPTGDAVVEAVQRVGDAVATRELVGPSYDTVQSALGALVGRTDVDAVVTVGGTGVEPDDVTVDAAADLFDKRLPGFGELFRVISHEHEGTAVVRTRATAGLVDGVPVFCLPGDADAARRGLEQIVLAEAETLADLASEDVDDA